MMVQNITTANLFEGKEVLTFERNGEIWFTLADLAAAWGVDRKTPGNLLGRNHDLFEGMYLSDGDVTYHDVNERGLYLLMGKISADRLKNPAAKDAIIRFQRWVPELIQQYRKREIVQVQQQPNIKAELIQAREEADVCQCDPRLLFAAVYRKHGEVEKAEALQVPVPMLVHGETGWYNPTRLIGLCNDPDLTPERLNWYLSNKGFQVKENGIWRLTPAGLIHGKEYPFNAPSGHSEPRIAWRESILYASGLKRDIPESQMALPSRVGY